MTTVAEWVLQDWTLAVLSKTVIVQLAVLTLVWFLRRSSAALRHLILTIGIGAVLTLPILSLAVPAWNIELLRPPIRLADANLGGSIIDIAPREPGSANSLHPGRTARAPLRLPKTSSRGNSMLPGWLGVCWVTGTLAVLSWLLTGWLLASWISRKSTVISDSKLIAKVEEIGAKLEIKRPVTVLLSKKTSAPVVSGIFRPKLILPEGISAWPGKRLESTLQHELAHICRSDVLTQYLAYLSCCVYWFNPLTWVMERRLMIERERACDNYVLAEDVKASEYAEHLLKVSEELTHSTLSAWALAPMAEGTDFKDRILSILDPNTRRNVPKPLTALLVVGLAALLVAPLAAFTPWEAQAVKGSQRDETAGPSSQSDPSNQSQAQNPAEPKSSRSASPGPAALQDQDPKTREHAASALGESADLKAVSALIDALNDPDPKVREHVASALGQIGDSGAVPALIERLSDRDARVREHVASALGQLADGRAVVPLIEAIKGEKNSRVRAHILEALGSIGDKRALPVLIEALSDPDPKIRHEAAEALGSLGDQRAIDPLRQALDDSSENVRQKARRSMNKLLEQ